jgi:signal transduction histidine kinase
LNKTRKELNEFVSLASHDIKAPLNAINNLADWLLEDIGSDINPKSLNHLMMIKKRVMRAKLLISDLSTYSRLGNDREPYTNLKLDEIAQICAAQANIGKFQFDVDNCDVTLPKQSFISVLTHLISNAVKHHPSDTGKICIKCHKLLSIYQIDVIDDGHGINPQDHSHVFEKLKTLKPRDDVEGSGMGLAIVEKALSAYGGRIRLKSDGVSGSTFIIEWPFESQLRPNQ